MKHRRLFLSLTGLVAALALLLAACATQDTSDDTQPSDTGTEVSDEQQDDAAGEQTPDGATDETETPDDATDETETPDESGGDAAQSLFTPGTWLSDLGQYYFFDADGAAGRTASLEDGTGVAFSYTAQDGEAVFALGAADNESACTVTGEGETRTLTWADGTVENLSYVSELGSDEFAFYTNVELADLALAYYKQVSGETDTEGLVAAAAANEDGTVAIQVYQNLGDHNSTSAWYTVDRLTATGTDADGNEVDLTTAAGENVSEPVA